MSEETNKKGWIGNLLETIVNSFNKLLIGIKKQGFKITLFGAFILLMLYSFIISPVHIGEMIEHKFYQLSKNELETKQEMIERRVEANEIVGDIMSKLLFKFNCNRVLLLEKHNSVASLGNVDFLYLSCTLEMIDFKNPDVDYISQDLQRQMTVNLLGNDVIGLLKHSKYLYFDDLENYKKSQCRLLNKLKEEGEKQAIIYPFFGKNHRPLLILVICGDNLNKKEIIEYIDEYSKQITDLLIFE